MIPRMIATMILKSKELVILLRFISFSFHCRALSVTTNFYWSTRSEYYQSP